MNRYEATERFCWSTGVVELIVQVKVGLDHERQARFYTHPQSLEAWLVLWSLSCLALAPSLSMKVRDGMRLQFVCAHLDSETVEAHMGNDFAGSRTQRATKCTGLARALLMWTFARKVCKISPLHFVFLATHVMSDKHLVKSILGPLNVGQTCIWGWHFMIRF